MKRDDIIAGVIGGTIFVVGCTVGIFGYQKMNEPLFAQTTVEESDQSYSSYIRPDNSEITKIEQDNSFYELSSDENNINANPEVIDNSRSIVEEDDNTYQESDEIINKLTDIPATKLDLENIDRLADNTRFSIDINDNHDSDYNFNKYDNEEQQNTSDAYVLNTSTLKIHYPNCSDVKKISPDNYSTSNESIDELRSQGYTLCGHCFR
ncbi:MAG: hypothetical protein K6G24_07860 [Lachnospiraceae bacterium]|nr:hypothetical protein [Lachnospiraceae bacterium]